MLSSLGFTEIQTLPIKDLVTGWVTKNGSVENVVIDGRTYFKKNMVFKYDVIITVYYHTFKKRGKKKDKYDSSALKLITWDKS